MSDHRIVAVTLDEKTVLWRNADVEQERRIAIFDLLEGNSFRPEAEYPDGYEGPYRLLLRVEEGRLALDIAAEDGRALDTLVLPLSPFRRTVRDYFAICDSYYQAFASRRPARSRPSTWPAGVSTTMPPRCSSSGWRARLRSTSTPRGGCSRSFACCTSGESPRGPVARRPRPSRIAHRGQALILAGLVFSGETRVEKPGQGLAADALLAVRGRDHPWASRGGVKLGARPGAFRL